MIEYKSRQEDGKRIKHADVAHLVERNLAKVEVASSSLVIRSIFIKGIVFYTFYFFAPLHD